MSIVNTGSNEKAICLNSYQIRNKNSVYFSNSEIKWNQSRAEENNNAYADFFFFSQMSVKLHSPQHVPLEDYIAFKNVSALVILEHLEHDNSWNFV